METTRGPRNARRRSGWAAAAGIIALGTLAPPAAAQEGGDTRALCLNGGPRPACATFVVVEVQGVLPLVRNTRLVRWFGGHEMEDTPYADRLQWELGFLHNVSERWALGGTVRLGAGSTDALTGVTVRARRWLSDDVGLDLSSGATFLAVSTPERYGRTTGWLADARLNFNDDAYAGLRYEVVPIEPFAGSEDTFDPGGNAQALSVLVGMGSEWAIGGTAALGLGLVLLLSLVDWE